MSENRESFNSIKIHKENGNTENFDVNRIKAAIFKASSRTQHYLEEDEINKVLELVYDRLDFPNKEGLVLDSNKIHQVVEDSLLKTYPDISMEYKQFRSYKRELNKKTDEVEKYLNEISKKNRFKPQFDQEYALRRAKELIRKHPRETYYSLVHRIMSDIYREQDVSKIKNYLIDADSLNKLLDILHKEFQNKKG